MHIVLLIKRLGFHIQHNILAVSAVCAQRPSVLIQMPMQEKTTETSTKKTTAKAAF